MTRAFLPISLCLVIAACGGGPECAVDTDCPLGQRCSADNACLPLGVVQDASRDAEPSETGAEVGPRDAGSDTGPTERGTGTVAIFSNGEADSASHLVFASFQDNDSSMPGACTQMPMGACVLTECVTPMPPDAGSPDAGAPDAGSPMAPSAGTLQVQAELAVTVTPDATGTYMSVSGAGALWNADTEMVRVSAAGDTVPAFNGNIPTPKGVVISSPVRDPLVAMGYSSSEVGSFSWSGAGFDGEVVVQFSKATAGGSLSLVCRFDATAGSAELPEGALAGMGVADGGVSLTVSIEGRTEVMAGGYAVALTTSSNALDSAGMVVSGPVNP